MKKKFGKALAKDQPCAQIDRFVVLNACSEVEGWDDPLACEQADAMTKKFHDFCFSNEIERAPISQLKDLLHLAEQWYDTVGFGAGPKWRGPNKEKMEAVIRELKATCYAREKRIEDKSAPVAVTFSKRFTVIEYSFILVEPLKMRLSLKATIFEKLYENLQNNNNAFMPWLELSKEVGVSRAEPDPYRFFRDEHHPKRTRVWQDIVKRNEEMVGSDIVYSIQLDPKYSYFAQP
jgi:hypothetical protein